MSLPYSNSSVGEKALIELQNILKKFKCDKFGTMIDWNAGTVMVQFEWQGMRVSFPASFKGYAEAYMKDKPYSTRMHCSAKEYKEKALEIGSKAVYSILRDWVKAQVVAIETGIVTFEEVFMAHLLLENGQRLIEHIKDAKLISINK